jgi:hypothetical protein
MCTVQGSQRPRPSETNARPNVPDSTSAYQNAEYLCSCRLYVERVGVVQVAGEVD